MFVVFYLALFQDEQTFVSKELVRLKEKLAEPDITLVSFFNIYMLTQ